jgi:uncharacterized protein with von Willebrand factor type A (vWA) domain
MPDGRLLRNILHFVRLLRELGLQVDPHRARLFAQALAQVGVAERSDFYFAARSCLIYRQQDLADFDRAFEAFWRSRFRGGIPLTLPAKPRRRAAESGPADNRVPSAGIESELAQGVGPLAYSAAEALRQKDFSELTAEELDQVKRLMHKVAWRLGEHPGRRQQAGKGRLPDYRRTFRSSLRYGGEPLVWALRQPRPKLRPLVVLADVSGSMEPYSRLLLQFLYGLANGLDQPPEIFVYSTRLSRITRALQSQDAEQALAGVFQEVLDWSGAHRRGAAAVQPALGPPGSIPRHRGRHHQRWAGSRPDGAAAQRSGPLAAELLASDVAEPPAGLAGLRTTGSGNAGGAALRGRLPSRQQLGQVGRAGPAAARCRGRPQAKAGRPAPALR